MAPRLGAKVHSGPSRHHRSFTDAEHAHIWRFVAEEFKQKNFTVLQRYGDLWEKYIRAGHSQRTLHSLRSHFGRHMYPRMHMADLPKDELFGLLKHFRVTLSDQQVNYLEEKIGCAVRRNSLGIIVFPSDSEDHHILPRKRLSDGQLAPAVITMPSTIPFSRGSENVCQAPKKPRVKQEVVDEDDIIPLATSTPMDVDGSSTKYGELVRGRTLKVLAGQLSTGAIFDGIPSETQQRHEEFAVLLKSLLADCAGPQTGTCIPKRPTHSTIAIRYVEDVKPSLPARRADASNQVNIELLRQQIAAAKKEIERYDSKINAVKHELYDIIDAREKLSC